MCASHPVCPPPRQPCASVLSGAAQTPLPCTCCPSLHPQNFFLYFFGTMFNLAGLLVVVATGGLAPGAVFNGFSTVGCACAGWVGLVGGGSGHRRLAWMD